MISNTMIHVSFYQTKQYITGFCIEGHAKDAPQGHSLLCAGISTLSQSIVIAIKDIIKIPMQYTKKTGYLKCVALPSTTTHKEQLHLLIQTMLYGIQNLSIQYPKQIEIKKIIIEKK